MFYAYALVHMCSICNMCLLQSYKHCLLTHICTYHIITPHKILLFIIPCPIYSYMAQKIIEFFLSFVQFLFFFSSFLFLFCFLYFFFSPFQNRSFSYYNVTCMLEFFVFFCFLKLKGNCLLFRFFSFVFT